jgi:putative tryptophan/tyrosine transport system substrate-binding protein
MGQVGSRPSRRQFVQGGSMAGLGLLAWCGLARLPGSEPKRVVRVGVLHAASPQLTGPQLDAFRQGMDAQGYREGQDYTLELRHAEGRNERLPALAEELVRLKVDVILTSGLAAIGAARQATKTIPIVFAAAGDPVGAGLVASLARPGGNATGLSIVAGDEAAKRLELLKEAVPGLSRVAVLWNPSSGEALRLAAGQFAQTEVAAQALHLQVLSLQLASPADLDSVQAAALAGGVDGLILVTGAGSATHVPQVAAFAAENRLPGISQETGFARAGGLMEYGTNVTENYRRAAAYVDKILKGTSPADIPVERPTKYEFIINLQTARALGLTIPPQVLAQATEVIQ